MPLKEAFPACTRYSNQTAGIRHKKDLSRPDLMPGCDKSNFIFMCLPPHWLRRLQTLWMPVHIVQYIFIILQNIDFRPVVPCDILYRNLLLRYHGIQCILPPKLTITFMDEQLQLFAKAGDLLLLYPGNATYSLVRSASGISFP